MPPLPSQATWTPDVIATVVYRVTMVFVSLTYIWRKYRQPLRTDDLHQIVELLAIRTPATEVKSEDIPEPATANSIDSNDILQVVQAFGTVIATTLGTDCDGISDTPSINVEVQEAQSAYPNRRQDVNKSAKDG